MSRGGIEVDGYSLSLFNDSEGKPCCWIRFPSGEAMGVPVEKLKEYLDRIYKEDF